MRNDSQLQIAVQDELRWEPSVTAANIGVAASAGVVTLSGHVENYAAKYAAEKAALRVRGVNAVAEEIEVRLPFDGRRGDDEIASAVLQRLFWNVSIPRDAIQVKVEKGFVTLSGKVQSHYQKEAVQQEVRRLHGVVGVANQIAIAPLPNAVAIGDQITAALHRSWFDPKAVSVSADGGKIRLTGTVHSPHERRLATATAWAAPGATSVENAITVN